MKCATRSNCSPTAPRSTGRRSSQVSSHNRRGPRRTARGEIARQLDGFEARRATGLVPPAARPRLRHQGPRHRGDGDRDGRRGARRSEAAGAARRAAKCGCVRSRCIARPVERAGLCQRVALNLTGAERMELKRGDVLADDRLELTTTRFDARPGNSAGGQASAQEQRARAPVHRNRRDDRPRDRAGGAGRNCTEDRARWCRSC